MTNVLIAEGTGTPQKVSDPDAQRIHRGRRERRRSSIFRGVVGATIENTRMTTTFHETYIAGTFIGRYVHALIMATPKAFSSM